VGVGRENALPWEGDEENGDEEDGDEAWPTVEKTKRAVNPAHI